MGMFDYINIAVKCPNCGEEMSGFQSKDGRCSLGHVEFWEVDYFYDSCQECNTWVRFQIKENVRKELPITAYEMYSTTEKDSNEIYKEHNPEEYFIDGLEKETK